MGLKLGGGDGAFRLRNSYFLFGVRWDKPQINIWIWMHYFTIAVDNDLTRQIAVDGDTLSALALLTLLGGYIIV